MAYFLIKKFCGKKYTGVGQIYYNCGKKSEIKLLSGIMLVIGYKIWDNNPYYINFSENTCC